MISEFTHLILGVLTVSLPSAKGILSKRHSPYTLIEFSTLDRASSSPIGLA
jgi:hypothetical protein